MTTFRPGDRVRFVGGNEGVVVGVDVGVKFPYRVQFDDGGFRCATDELTLVSRPAPGHAALLDVARELVAVAGERQDHADNRRPDHADALTGPVERAEEQFRAALLASRLTEACDLLGPYATAELRVAGGLPTVKVRSSALYAALAHYLGLPLGDGPGLRFTAHAHGVAWDVGPTP